MVRHFVICRMCEDWTLCLYRTLTRAEGRVFLADQRYRFRELQISSDAGGLWGQQAIVIR